MSNQASLGDISGGSDSASNKKKTENQTLEEKKLSVFPNDWKTDKVDDLFDIEIDRKDPSELDTEVKHFSMPSYDEGREPVQEHSSEINSKKNKVPETTLLFPKLNIRKKRFWLVDEEHGLPALASTEYWPLMPKEELNLHFYDFYFNSYHFMSHPKVSTSSSTNSHQRVTKKFFKTIGLPKPPIHEQRRIASVLYNVDQAIQKTEEIIEQTQRVKKGLMQDLFTEGYYSHEEFEEKWLLPLTQKMPISWDTPAMSEIMSSQELGTNERGASDDPDKNITLIKMGNLGFGNWDFSELEKVERTEEVMENTLEKGDMLFNTRNTPELVGKTAVWEFDREAVHDNNLMKINFGERVATPHYVNYYLASNYGRTQLRGRVHGTTSVAAIYNKDLDDIKIPLPEKEEQEKIANSLHSLDKKIEENRKYKEQLQRLKKGLMQDLLTGSVRTGEDVEVLDEVVEVEG